MTSPGWASFDWQDPFLMAAQFSDEERLIRETARVYARDRLAPRIRDAYRTESTDPAIFREMGELGLLGSTIGGYGCPGVNDVGYGLIAREIERVDSGYRSMLSGNGIADDYPVFRHMANLEAVNTYEGAHDVHALILGRAQTGIAAF